LGPPGIDGKFGPYTEGAIKQFQIDNGLKGKEGIAGPETWTAICDLLSLPNKSKPLYQSQQFNCNPNSATLQVGSEDEKVIELQTYLTDLGYGDLLEPEKIDGKFGIYTKNSVMAYQKDFGLSVDGKVGPQTWGSLCEQISLLPITFPTNKIPDKHDASSANEIQMDTNGDGVVDELDAETTTEATDADTDAATTGNHSNSKNDII